MSSLDPAVFDDDEMRAALAARDIGKVYRSLRRLGVSQRRMGQLTGQSQSEVSEILRGRQVCNVTVLERIADGLGIPRARLGLSYAEEPEAPPAQEDVDEAVKRRTLIATATTEIVGQVLIKDKPVELALPSSGQPLPSRLGISDVHAVRAVTEQLRGVARDYGGQADVVVATATAYARWLQVPAPEAVKAQFAAALAELHAEAGWCCYDSGLDGTACFTRALRLAGKAGDPYEMACATWRAGLTLVRVGHPNDALKLFQLGQLRLSGFRLGRSTPATLSADDPRLPTLKARLGLQSATAYALMGGRDEAIRCLAEAHDGWEPRNSWERAGGHFVTAAVQLDLGQLDAAEHSATRALRSYGEHQRRDRTQVELLLAEVYVRAGELQGLSLAHQAIETVSTLHSVAARVQRLVPLAAALEARPSPDARQLAHRARQVATART